MVDCMLMFILVQTNMLTCPETFVCQLGTGGLQATSSLYLLLAHVTLPAEGQMTDLFCILLVSYSAAANNNSKLRFGGAQI